MTRSPARPGQQRAPAKADAPAHGARAHGAPARLSLRRAPLVQRQLQVNQPGDRFEQQADRVADQVMRSPVPVEQEPAVEAAQNPRGLQRAPTQPDGLQREGEGTPSISPTTAATIGSPGAGSPLASPLRSRIEPHLGADLSGVRVHAGPAAAQAAASLQARAFTHRNHIFLARGESSADLRLMAHEATHVVQQGAAAVQRQPAPAQAVPEIQRLFDFSLDDLPGIDAAEIARRVPGFTLFTVIAGYNPLTNANVARTPINLLQGLMELVPFGAEIFDALNERGIISAAFNWVEGELGRLDLSLDRIERTLDAAWEEIEFTAGVDYNLGVLRRHFGRLLEDVISFARSLVDHLLEMIKEAAIDMAEDLLAENRAWALIKKILHYDPLRGEPVEATTVEILEDFLLLIGKEQELEQMRARGTLERTAAWLDTQIGTFFALLAELRSLIDAAWAAIQPENLPNLAENLQALADRVGGFLQRVWGFALTVAITVLEYIKDALLGMLSDFAHEVPGFHLLTVILGRNPFTGERVPRNAENLIRGFITLLPGGNQAYEELQQTGTIQQAAQRIEGSMAGLGITPEFITGLFLDIWNSLSIEDLIDPAGAFQRVVDQFGEPIARLFAFVQVVLRELFMLILQLMNFPTDMVSRIIANAMQAFDDIKRDPVAFFKNMLQAVKQGFSSFFGNILQYLLAGVTDWLFGQFRNAGIQLPSTITLESILDLVMQVLGITTDRLWEKLGEHIGRENVERIRGAIDRLTGILAFVRDVQERGVAAIWEYIQGQISNLWDTLLEQAKNWIMQRIIERVTARLLSMLDPTGIMAVVNSFVAFFNAIQSAIEYFREILAIIDRYVSTIASVARGDVEPGAVMLEQGLASSIPVAIGFLANQVGLGNLADKIAEIVSGVRGVVDRALDWLMQRVVGLARSLLRTLGLGGAEEAPEVSTGDPEHDAAVGEGLAAIATLEQEHAVNGRISRDDAETIARTVRERYPVFTSLTVVDGGDSWDYAWAASPGDTYDTPAQKSETTSAFAGRRITEPGIGQELVAAGYRTPYQRNGRWIIARQDASSGLPRLSVDGEIIQIGPSEDESDRGEIMVEIEAILAAVGDHPHRELFSIDPTAGVLRLGSSLRREALAAFRPRETAQMRRALVDLLYSEEPEDLVEIPVGGLTELAEVEATGALPVSGSGLRNTAMSHLLIDQFVDILQTTGAWPVGWEVHHVVPTDWGGNDEVSNYAAIPAAAHQDITNWWNRLRGRILADAEAQAAYAEATTAEFRSIRFE